MLAIQLTKFCHPNFYKAVVKSPVCLTTKYPLNTYSMLISFVKIHQHSLIEQSGYVEIPNEALKWIG